MKKLSTCSIILGITSLSQISVYASGGYLYCVPTNGNVTKKNSPYALPGNSNVIPLNDKNVYSVENKGIWITGSGISNNRSLNGIGVYFAHKVKAENFCQILQQKCKADFGDNYGKYVGAYHPSIPEGWFKPWLQVTPMYLNDFGRFINVPCDTRSP